MRVKVAPRKKRSAPGQTPAKPRKTRPRITRGEAATSGVAGFLQSLPTIDASRAREGISELLGRVGFGGEHIAVARHGKIKAVLVSPEDYERYRIIEDLMDGAAAEKALKEFEASGEEAIPYSKIREELGLGRRR